MHPDETHSEHDDAHAARAHAAPLSWWELWPMLAWGAYTVYLYATGRLFYLLQRIYGHLALAGGVVLLAAFAYGWVLRWRAIRAEVRAAREGRPAPGGVCPCGCGGAVERPSWGRYVRSLAFLAPLAVGMSLPARGPNSLAAVQWGAGDFAMMAELAARQELEAAQMKGDYGWVTVLGLAQRLAAGRPEKVGARGFVARKGDTPGDRFYLVRFTMVCCAACATPVAVPVRWDGASTLAENQWVDVYGRIDPEAKVLEAEAVQLTTEPANPYM